MCDPGSQDVLYMADELILFSTSSIVFKAAILLGIPDIIARAGPNASLTAPQIAAHLPSQSTNVDYLSRVLRFLATQRIFTVMMAPRSSASEDVGETEDRYGLTDQARLFVTENNPHSLAPLLLFVLDEAFLAPLHRIHESVLEGVQPFRRAHGKDMWTVLKEDPRMKKLFYDGMASATKGIQRGFLELYDGFKDVDTLVDVGGGSGHAIQEIVTVYSHVKGINFDLPHIIATAPDIPGVRHVAGDMFESIPHAGAVFIKMILHNWNDEECVRILRNCYKAEGKIIIVDTVIDESNLEKPTEQRKVALDMLMLARTGTGRERTEEQWRRLLSCAGFGHAEIHGINAPQSIIEAFKPNLDGQP